MRDITVKFIDKEYSISTDVASLRASVSPMAKWQT